MGIMKNMFTESDNVTYDLYKYLSLCSICTGLALEVFCIVQRSQPFDMQTFGIGVGGLFAGVGLALKLKPETAPNPSTNP